MNLSLNDDDESFDFLKTPIFEVSAWLQSFSNSFHSFQSSNDQNKKNFLAPIIKKWEIERINFDFNADFNKQGILTKNSIIRIMFWYQKIIEQMLFLFKTRMNEFINSSFLNEEIVQKELDSFIFNLNELTKKCKQRINNCLNSNDPDPIKKYQPLNNDQKIVIINYLLNNFFALKYTRDSIESLAAQLSINYKRLKKYIFLQRRAIYKYLLGKGEIPNWMLQKFSDELNFLKHQVASSKERKSQKNPNNSIAEVKNEINNLI